MKFQKYASPGNAEPNAVVTKELVSSIPSFAPCSFLLLVARLKLHDRLTHVHVTCQPDSYAVPVGPAERESLDALAAIANYSAIGLRY
jgi:hypothetical protein